MNISMCVGLVLGDFEFSRISLCVSPVLGDFEFLRIFPCVCALYWETLSFCENFPVCGAVDSVVWDFEIFNISLGVYGSCARRL